MAKAKKLSIEQLQQVFLGHEGEEVSLQRLAKDCGLNSSRELAEAFSALLKLPLTEIPEEHHIEREIIALVPEQIARRYTLIPFEKKGDHASTLLSYRQPA